MTWAIPSPYMEAHAARALRLGADLGPVVPMTRELPDGARLTWRLTRSSHLLGDGLVPFLIAWNPGAHPCATSPPGAQLVSLRGEHPEPDRIMRMLDAVGVALAVTLGATPAPVATVEGVRGTVELR